MGMTSLQLPVLFLLESLTLNWFHRKWLPRYLKWLADSSSDPLTVSLFWKLFLLLVITFVFLVFISMHTFWRQSQHSAPTWQVWYHFLPCLYHQHTSFLRCFYHQCLPCWRHYVVLLPLSILGRYWKVWVTVSSLGILLTVGWNQSPTAPWNITMLLACCIAGISMWLACHQIQTGTLYPTGLHAILSQMPFEIYKGVIYLQLVLVVFPTEYMEVENLFSCTSVCSETCLFFCSDFTSSCL